jgi:hypothetical protein
MGILFVVLCCVASDIITFFVFFKYLCRGKLVSSFL